MLLGRGNPWKTPSKTAKRKDKTKCRVALVLINLESRKFWDKSLFCCFTSFKTEKMLPSVTNVLFLKHLYLYVFAICIDISLILIVRLFLKTISISICIPGHIRIRSIIHLKKIRKYLHTLKRMKKEPNLMWVGIPLTLQPCPWCALLKK
jgi:hypothetical protein